MKLMHRSLAALAVLFGVVVMGVTSAPAADCGDTAGPGGTDLPCACGDTVVTSTVLDTSDPVVSTGPGDFCPGNGLIVGASGIVLDLNAKTIRGSGSGSDSVGVTLVGVDDVILRNGTVTRFGFGVWGSDIRANLLTVLTLEANDFIGVVFDFTVGPVRDNRVLGSTVRGVGWAGISLMGTDVNPQTGNLITNNTIADSGSSGIELLGVSGDAAQGIPGNTVAGNVVSNAAGRGIWLADARENIVEKNKVSGGGGDIRYGGVALDSADRNVIKNNQVAGRGAGISLCEANSNTINANRVLGNGVGLWLRLGGFGFCDQSSGNVVSLNIADGNSWDGVRIETDGNTVTGNRGKGSGDDGLDITGAGNAVGRNVFDRNGDWGICVDAGNLDTGGNRASRNGNGQISFTGACSY